MHQTPSPPKPKKMHRKHPHLPPAPLTDLDDDTQTPPLQRTRVKRVPKVQGQTPRDIFLEGQAHRDNARGDDDGVAGNERISHDLSLTENPRHSVMDNMLLSLNPDQPRFVSTPPENPPLSAPIFNSPKTPNQGHKQSSSLNSDFTFPSPPDDSPARFTSQQPRGCRSNSSSNFQPALGRIDSVHGPEEKPEHTRTKVYQAQRAGFSDRAPAPSSRGGRRSTKSSGSSSVDFGQMMGQQRVQPPQGRRSSSFDHGRSSRGTYTSSSDPPFPAPMVKNVSKPPIYDNVEAAPTPTVHGGPRREPPQGIPQAQVNSAPPIQRRNSNKSSKSQYGKKSKEMLAWDTSLGDGTAVLDKKRRPPRMIISSSRITSRATSPTRLRSEPVISLRQGSVSVPVEPNAARPGFFRRMFSSSKGTPSPLEPRRQFLQSRAQSQRNSIRAESPTAFAGTRKMSEAGLADVNQLPKEAIHPVIVKKPSSFFRRRKKSISEVASPPVMPLHLQPHLQGNSSTEKLGQSSPVSSLRQVMDPFLADATAPNREVNERDLAVMNLPPAPIVPSEDSHLASDGPRKPYLQSLDGVQLSKSQNKDATPAPREKRGSIFKFRSHPSPRLNSGETFLHDNSSSETKRPGASDKAETPVVGPATLTRASKSFPADMRCYDENQNPRKALGSSGKQSASSPKILSPRSGTFPSSPLSPRNTAERLPLQTQNGVVPSRPRKLPAPLLDKAIKPWLDNPSSEEDLRRVSSVSLPLEGAIEGAEVSPVSDYQSARNSIASATREALDSPSFLVESPTVDDATLPTEDDRLQAKKIFDGDESFCPKGKAAAWLGDSGPGRPRVRRAYMELFDWPNLSILAALRDFCGRLLLKGETQQVDRILDAFSTRWCACNSNHGFKATDVVHTVCYSILLLNTDLHMADIEQKMTRTQFIKNTLPTIRRVAADAAPGGFENNKRASTLPPQRPSTDYASEPISSPSCPRGSSEGRRSFEASRPSYRLSQRPSDQAALTLRSTQSPTPYDNESLMEDCGPLVKAPFQGKLSAWEAQVEIVLKGFYNSIRTQRLPLHGSDVNEIAQESLPSTNTLSVFSGNLLRRTNSTLSKAGSENVAIRGRPADTRLGTGRWTSKTRSRPRLYPTSTVASSRTSLEDQNSIWSPAQSSTWSKYSLGKTQTSMSLNSYASSHPQGEYQQSIGFANALSHAIIREEVGNAEQVDETLRVAPLLEDESLELAGAPWAKEGILKHKHHLLTADKKAKDRDWIESFAVIEKGWLRLFSFNTTAKSMRQKAKAYKAPGSVVGGGNWMDNAEDLGKYLLRQTIASALPPPGYSKARPHVWALSLPTGAVHLFQVGTPEIVKEFVSTANYWSARLSKEPLVGAISNIEYGWSDAVVNAAFLHTDSMPPSSSSTNNHSNAPRPSLQSSIRSSMDAGSSRPRLPGDRIMISDWTPPQQSMVASVLMEVDQLRGLCIYVRNVEEELGRHNELRGAVGLAFSPRHPNATKSMHNWEKKSSYLLREIVKFRTYIDALTAAQTLKEKVLQEKIEREGCRDGEKVVAAESEHRAEDEREAEVEKEGQGSRPA